MGAGGCRGAGCARSSFLWCEEDERVTGLVMGTVLGETGEVGGEELDGRWAGAAVI